MALKTLNPSIRLRPDASYRIDAGPIIHLPPRRSHRVPQIAGRRRRFAAAGRGRGERISAVAQKKVDLATLGNLCVDIVLPVPSLPPEPQDERLAYLERLASSPPDKKYWEAGGNCNLAIAAARVGLSCYALGHVDDDIYGNFLLDVLRDERIEFIGMSECIGGTAIASAYKTLICWVLVDPFHRHGFCSRADFSEYPAFTWMSDLTGQSKKAIRQSKILFCNGYAFDELYPELIVSALNYAIASGTAVFFDPGPRGKTLLHGSPEQRKAIEAFLRFSDVLLLTSDEAESLTGIQNPIQAGYKLVKESDRTKWVVIKLGCKGSILITSSLVSCAPSFKVNVVDTVGCGDSYTSAIAFGFLHNLPAVHTIALANAVGAATATGCGAGRNVAHLEKVLELLKQSNINEDASFWGEVIEGSSWSDEIVLLSQASSINRRSDRVAHIPIHNVIKELIPKFEAVHEQSIVGS